MADGLLTVRVPMAHGVHGEHVGAFSALLKVPLGHSAQTRSVVAEGGAATKVPAGQTVHGWQFGEFNSEENEPAGQISHAASAVLLPKFERE